MFIFIFLANLAFCLHQPLPLVVLQDTILTDIDFYEKVSKDDWDSFDLEKKERVFNDFLKNELGYYDAINKGVHLNPKTAKALNVREKQVLLNNTYEHLIARPNVSSEEVDKNKLFLQKKVEAYHLLIGYEGSAQNTESFVPQNIAKNLVDSLYFAILKESKKRDLESVFMDFSKIHSIDPSAKQNSGFLGWVPWGRTVMSFQEPLFLLPLQTLSKPIHTEYGYHLIIKKKEGLSSHYYYSEDKYNDLAVKLAEGSLSFDSLRSASSAFDSLVVKEAKLVFNDVFIDSFMAFVLKKQQEDRLAGNKNQLINWIGSFQKNSFLFKKNNSFFGLGWLKQNLIDAPSSRIPKIKTKKELKDLILFFVLQEEVLFIGKKENIKETTSFKTDWLNNKKNIVYNDYLTFLMNDLGFIDSSMVIEEYKKQSLGDNLLKPKRVVFSEIRVFKQSVADSVLKELSKGVSFDSLLVGFGGSIKEPVSNTKKTPLSSSLFTKKVGEISGVIPNNDGSFSIARVERFLEKELFSLNLVYGKIERELISSAQDSIKVFLLDNLLKDLNPKLNRSNIGL